MVENTKIVKQSVLLRPWTFYFMACIELLLFYIAAHYLLPYLWLPEPWMLFSMLFILSLFFGSVVIAIYSIILAGLRRKQLKKQLAAHRGYEVISVIFLFSTLQE